MIIKDKNYYDTHYVLYNKSLGLFFTGFANRMPAYSIHFEQAKDFCNLPYAYGYIPYAKLKGFAVCPLSYFMDGGRYA